MEYVFHMGNETFGDGEDEEEEWDDYEDETSMDADNFDGEEEAEDEEGEAWTDEDYHLHELVEKLVEANVAAVRKKFAEKGIVPEHELEKAARLRIVTALAGVARTDEGATEQEIEEEMCGTFLKLINKADADTQAGIMRAFDQLVRCKETGLEEALAARRRSCRRAWWM